MTSGTADGTGAGTGAVVSRSGVLNLTLGRARDPPLVRTISDIKINCAKGALLTECATGALYLCTEAPWRLLNQPETSN